MLRAPLCGLALGLVLVVWVPAVSGASSQQVACVSETGTGGICADGTALDGATGVSLSPDGANVYVASETSRAVAVFARDPVNGAVSQLPGTAGCVSASGTGGACADGTAMVGPRSITLSPDGNNLYFPATSDAAVAVFSRQQTTGVLTQLGGTAGCISESGTNGSCDVGVALSGARSAASSPDGTHVYVASFFSDAVAAFRRDASTGQLTQLAHPSGCISETSHSGLCADGVALDGARTVVVSPEGDNVYVAAELSGSVGIFARNGTTGTLTQLPGLDGCVSQTGTGGACADVRALAGAAGVAVSPDGSHVYVASMASDALASFHRNQSTGALTQMTGTAGCVSETGSGGSCMDGRGLDRARWVAISPEGGNVYVAAESGDAIAVFSRDLVTGHLTQLSGQAGCVSETGSGGQCADGVALDGVRAVAVSPDGSNVYSASFFSSAVSVFTRNQTSGALTQLSSGPPANAAPVVLAGSDQTVTLPAGAFLDGTVTDDGRPNPPATVTVGWMQVSGPGTAILDDPSAVDTTARFPTAGAYTLRLTADDSALVSFDELTVTVTEPSVNSPPEIISDGGGPAAFLQLAENQTTVTDVEAVDPDVPPNPLTYAIVGGDDRGDFTIEEATGILRFVIAPDYEASTDTDLDNVYHVEVSVSDGALSDMQSISVAITNVDETFDFSLLEPGTVGSVSVANEDIAAFDGTIFSVVFDGSDAGISALRIDAYAWLDGARLLLSFDTPGDVPGVGNVDDSDVVLYSATAGTFSLYFDGSDVGLTTSGEDIDALELLADGRIILSTTATFSAGGANGEDEDLIEFVPATLGAETGGTFSLYFDGSDLGLTNSGEDVDAVAIDSTGRIYLSTVNNFAVAGITGADEDVFVFTPISLGANTSGTFTATLLFDGSTHGLSTNDLSAIDLR